MAQETSGVPASIVSAGSERDHDRAELALVDWNRWSPNQRLAVLGALSVERHRQHVGDHSADRTSMSRRSIM
jgi:hypothetical protein